MTIYIKNKITGEISSIQSDNFLALSKNIRDLNDEATQEESDAFALQEAKDSKIAKCKSTASSLIAASYPLHTQLNHLAEVATIQDRQIAGDTIPQEDLDSLQNARDVKDFINAIRVQSQAFEAAIIAAATFQDVTNINIDFS